MASVTAETAESADTPSVAVVDPRAPRFGQTITALGMVGFLATGDPVPLFAVAAVLVTSVVSGWRVDAYGLLWRSVMVPLLGAPAEKEPASPHRFAKLMGATFTATASVLVVAGVPLAAMVVAATVGLLAGVAAAFDICVGCRMYRQVRFFRDLGVV